MYYALYRKYRPSNFNDVVGQNVIVTSLKNSVKNKTFTHAYMFFGPRGTGKTTISKIFARAVNCIDPIDGSPCNNCIACNFSIEKECVDIIEIDAASNNGVDEIRELKSKISLVPSMLKYKVYIIDEVHMLSIGAFNALLKTLEEPPEHAIFILATTDPQKVPDTIISRCQCFSFKKIAEKDVVEKLKTIVEQENICIDPLVLSNIASFCGGGMRDAIGMLDKVSSYTDEKITEEVFAELNSTITRTELEEFSNIILNADIVRFLSVLNKYNDLGKNLVQIMIQLLHYVRNIIVDYYVNNTNYFRSIDEYLNLANLLNDNISKMKKADNPRIYIEIIFIEFCENKNKSRNLKNISREIFFDEKVEKQENSLLQTNVCSLETTKEVNSINKSNLLPLNIADIIEARVNNILAKADKKVLKTIIENINIFNDYTFDSDIGFAACALLDANIRAASNEGFILSYEYDSIVEQNLINLKKIMKIYNDFNNSNFKIAIISDSDWERVKNDYIKTVKSGGSFSNIDEPAEQFLDDNANDDIISSSAMNLFGDIVEIE